MGFCPTEDKARDIVGVLGASSKFEQVHGAFPTDEDKAARAWERSQPVRSIVTVVPPEVTTVELSPEELQELKSLLHAADEAVFMDADPWPDSEQTEVRSVVAGPGESGFFLPAQVG